MPESHEDPLTERFAHARAIMWLSAQYVMSSIENAKASHGGDAMRAMIFTAIWTANISYARRGLTPQDGLAPDALRRPVTISRLASLVGAPSETVRRHVVRLIEDGLCVRVGRKGVVVPSQVFLRQDMMVAAEKQLAAAIRYSRALAPLLADEG